MRFFVVSQILNGLWCLNEARLALVNDERALNSFYVVVVSEGCFVNGDINVIFPRIFTLHTRQSVVAAKRELVSSLQACDGGAEVWVFRAMQFACIVSSNCCVCLGDVSLQVVVGKCYDVV